MDNSSAILAIPSCSGTFTFYNEPEAQLSWLSLVENEGGLSNFLVQIYKFLTKTKILLHILFNNEPIIVEY